MVGALLLLAALYAYWAARDGNASAALAFALPPSLLALASFWKPAIAAFWAGVLALGWFSHGVMIAWSNAPDRYLAAGAIALSLAIVFAASWSGLQARFGRKAGS